MQFGFGSGALFGTRTDIANPTPRQFGILQEGTVDFSFTVKKLNGTYQFPVAVARGIGSISGKAKFANLNAGLLNDLFFQGSAAANEIRTAINEPATIPSTPYMVTVANSATWTADLGVFNRITGRFMTQVASSPATGQYSVAAGVYTFAAADTTNTLYICYTYTFTSTFGEVITINNQLLGTIPLFSLALYQGFGGDQLNLHLNQATSSKLAFATKLEDFQLPEFDFEAFADASGTIGIISVAKG